MTWRYLDLADFLLIAEAVLEIPADTLAREGRLALAESALLAARNGGRWSHPPDDPKGEKVGIIEGVAAGRIGEDELTAWVAERLA